jgi:peptidoglycan/LPS O-acetylase OafA/YrhL
LYLLHPLVLSTLQRLNLLRHSTLTLAGYIVLGVSLSFAVAHASYTLVEQRFLRLRDRVSPETASPSNATATTAAKSSNG